LMGHECSGGGLYREMSGKGRGARGKRNAIVRRISLISSPLAPRPFCLPLAPFPPVCYAQGWRRKINEALPVNRSTIVYILMIGVFALGLWGILAAGSHLTAREDLSGDWSLTPLPGTSGDMQSLRVLQSGRFVKLIFSNGPGMQMKMIDDVDAGGA